MLCQQHKLAKHDGFSSFSCQFYALVTAVHFNFSFRNSWNKPIVISLDDLWFSLLVLTTFFLVGMHCRVVLTTTTEWGAVMTKLNVPADWKGRSLSLSLSIFLDMARLSSYSNFCLNMQSGRYMHYF